MRFSITVEEKKEQWQIRTLCIKTLIYKRGVNLEQGEENPNYFGRELSVFTLQ